MKEEIATCNMRALPVFVIYIYSSSHFPNYPSSKTEKIKFLYSENKWVFHFLFFFFYNFKNLNEIFASYKYVKFVKFNEGYFRKYEEIARIDRWFACTSQRNCWVCCNDEAEWKPPLGLTSPACKLRKYNLRSLANSIRPRNPRGTTACNG